MLKTLKNAWGIEELRKKILFTLFIILVYRLGNAVPVPYVNTAMLESYFNTVNNTILGLWNTMSGVMPIIFAQSIASIPGTICAFVPGWQDSWLMENVFNTDTVPYAIIYFLLIIAFSYFYATIQFDPVEIANNLKKNGGFIPGFRAGKPTSEYIRKVLNKITLMGALYLSVVAVVPILIGCFTTATSLSGISLGGTSIIIVVGVAIETVRAVEAQMLMRNYKGFLE